MKKKHRYLPILILQFVVLCSMGCSSGKLLEEQVLPVLPSPDSIEIENDIIENDSLGRINAVKKAYQMTDLFFTPLAPIGYRTGVFEAGVTYQGVIYSSAKELEEFVGNDISLHTYMTAIHNPRSKIYTEDISQPPYHGLNCRTYYGAVCSSFVSHALGIENRYWANDFPLSDLMEEIDSTNPDSIKLADVLWRDGHVAMITNLIKDDSGRVNKLEISECAGKGCRRFTKKRTDFSNLMKSSFQKIFRYTELYKNIDYTSCPEFVPVLDEEPVPFQYNDFLCVNKGDKSCYLENEEVVVNVMHPYEYMEIYKDDLLHRIIETKSDDVSLTDLTYGDYRARIFTNSQYSDYTYWKVVNAEVTADRSNNRIYFKSANATPLFIRYCDIHGNGGSLTTNNLHVLSDVEKSQGFIEVTPDRVNSKYPYIRVIFQTEFAKVINTPINWFE